MAALVCMPCMYWQRAVILLHTFMFFDVVLGFLQVYTINQKYQRDLMYVLQSYVVEPAIVRFKSNSFSVVCCSMRTPQPVLGPFSALFRLHDNSMHFAPLVCIFLQHTFLFHCSVCVIEL